MIKSQQNTRRKIQKQRTGTDDIVSLIHRFVDHADRNHPEQLFPCSIFSHAGIYSSRNLSKLAREYCAQNAG